MDWIKLEIDLTNTNIKKLDLAKKLYPDLRETSAAGKVSRKLTGDVAWTSKELERVIEIISDCAKHNQAAAAHLLTLAGELKVQVSKVAA